MKMPWNTAKAKAKPEPIARPIPKFKVGDVVVYENITYNGEPHIIRGQIILCDFFDSQSWRYRIRPNGFKVILMPVWEGDNLMLASEWDKLPE